MTELNDSTPSDRSDRIRKFVADAQRRRAAGEDLSDDALIAEHPDLMPELEQELRKLRMIEAAREEAEQTLPASDIPINPADDPTLAEGANGTDLSTAPTMVRYFGDYQILGKIAEGGMGVVYKANQVTLNRTVALKMIRSGELANEQERQRFYSEAENAANLDHPNIVPIYEIGQHQGQHYFSMAYVEGDSLADRIREQPLPSRQAAEYVCTVAEAIHYAHEQGILHRDIKPSNVLLNAASQPRVTDFGLAKQVGSDSDLTATGQVLGTPSYMPPEQAMGDSEAVGTHSDVYSLGALLYALVTGRPPFQADTTVGTLMQVIEKEPVSPRELNPAIDRDLETICMKSLEKEPPRRYESAQALADDIGRYLAGQPILARPIGQPARAWRWCKRNPVVAGLSATVAVVLLVGSVVSTYFAVEAGKKAVEAGRERDRANQTAEDLAGALSVASEQRKRADRSAAQARENEKKAQDAAVEARDQRDRAIQQEALAEQRLERNRRRAYASQLARVVDIWREQPLRAKQLLEDEAVCPPEMRALAWRYLYRLVNRIRSTIQSEQDLNRPILTPDHRLVITAGASGRMQVWDTATGKQLATLGGRSNLSISKDSRFLVTSSPDCVVRWIDVESGKSVRRLAFGLQQAGEIALSHDGSHAQLQKSSARSFWNTSNRSKKSELGFSAIQRIVDQGWVALEPNGRIFSGVQFRSRPNVPLQRWDTATGKRLPSISVPGGEFLAISYDGGVSAWHRQETIILWDNVAAKQRIRIPVGKLDRHSTAFSRKGDLLGVSHWDSRQRKRIVQVWNTRSGELAGESTYDARTAANDSIAMAFDEKSSQVAFGSSELYVLHLDSGARRGPFKIPVYKGSGYLYTRLYLAGGRLYGRRSYDGRVDVWDITNGTRETLFWRTADIGLAEDDNTLVLASRDEVVHVWDLETFELARSLYSEDGSLTFVGLAPDGRTIKTLDGERAAYWDVTTGEQVADVDRAQFYCHMINGELRDQLVQAPLYESSTRLGISPRDVRVRVIVSPDSTVQAVLRSGYPVELRKYPDGARIRSLDGRLESRPLGAVFSSDGRLFACSTRASNQQGIVSVWDVERGAIVSATRMDRASACVAFSADGNRLVCDGGETLDLKSGKLWPGPSGLETISPDLSTAVISSFDHRSLFVWGLEPPPTRFVLNDQDEYDLAVLSPAPSDLHIRVARGNASCHDVISGVKRWDYIPSEGSINNADSWALSPDGTRAAFLTIVRNREPKQPSVNRLVILNARTGEVELSREGLGGGYWLSFSDDGNSLYWIARGPVIRRWDIASDQVDSFPYALPRDNYIRELRLLGENALVMLVTLDDRRVIVRRLNLAARVTVAWERECGLGGYNCDLDVSLDQKCVVTTVNSSSEVPYLIKIWDAESGLERLTLRSPWHNSNSGTVLFENGLYVAHKQTAYADDRAQTITVFSAPSPNEGYAGYDEKLAAARALLEQDDYVSAARLAAQLVLATNDSIDADRLFDLAALHARASRAAENDKSQPEPVRQGRAVRYAQVAASYLWDAHLGDYFDEIESEFDFASDPAFGPVMKHAPFRAVSRLIAADHLAAVGKPDEAALAGNQAAALFTNLLRTEAEELRIAKSKEGSPVSYSHFKGWTQFNKFSAHQFVMRVSQSAGDRGHPVAALWSFFGLADLIVKGDAGPFSLNHDWQELGRRLRVDLRNVRAPDAYAAARQFAAASATAAESVAVPQEVRENWARRLASVAAHALWAAHLAGHFSGRDAAGTVEMIDTDFSNIAARVELLAIRRLIEFDKDTASATSAKSQESFQPVADVVGGVLSPLWQTGVDFGNQSIDFHLALAELLDVVAAGQGAGRALSALAVLEGIEKFQRSATPVSQGNYSWRRAKLLREGGQFEEALAFYRNELAEKQPEWRSSDLLLARIGEMLCEARQFDEALESFERMSNSRLDTDCMFARFLATCPDERYRDPTRALGLVQQVSLNYARNNGNYRALESRAAAHAAHGEFHSAVQWQQMAIASARADVLEANISDMVKRLALYVDRQPYLAESQAK